MEYKAPLRDMRFVLHELFDATGHCELLGNGLDRELIDGVLEEAARYTGGEIAPLNRNSDEEGVTLENGEVKTPQGFVEAYQQYVDNGWASMTGPSEYGGQGFPQLVACNFHEMLMAASLSFRIYSGLTEGAVLALYKHGSDELKNAYLAKLVSGQWSGTMCLTEPQAGTDLALLRTRAEPQADGSYRVSGSKIFISGGEHDMSENIVHLVLARLPDAPAGVKGISLLLVPKFIANADGTPGMRNALSCGAIEHKMGIKGAATCVMNFDGARGWIVGAPNQGLACMFTMMNDARFQVGLQGLGIAEQAYQGSLAYARERLQSRGLAGAQCPDKPADPIIVHPDVRRMLLTQKTLVEGSRMLAAYCARQLDLEHGHPEPSYRKAASKRAALLIPIVKAFFTDMGQEVASLGVQVYGGHGYIREWGMEQLMRDSRITQLYEGTNGIQALDLVGRKLPSNGGRAIMSWFADIDAFVAENGEDEAIKPFVDGLADTKKKLQDGTMWLMQNGMANPDNAGAASTDYLHIFGLTALAYMWAQMAKSAQTKIAAGDADPYYVTKLQTGRYFVERILPDAAAHLVKMKTGAELLMQMPAEAF